MKFHLQSIKIPVLVVLTLLTALAASGRTINVRGRVINDGTKEPLQSVTIRSGATGKLIGSTNMEGRFTVPVDEDDELIFSCMTCEPLTEPVKGRMNLEVSLMPKANQLDEVVVMAQGRGNVMDIGKAELDVKGNYIYLKKHVKIPRKLFSSGVRMIIQPTIYNVTKRRLDYLEPVVFDGHRYAITQRRMLDWDESKDPLTPYRTIKTTSRRKDDQVTISDSLYVDNPSDDFMCLVMTSMENYNRVVYADTFMIARGTVNPLRFLGYSLQAYDLDDEAYMPQPDIYLRDTNGDVNLTFDLGKSTLNPDLGDNRAELDKMLDEFRAIQNDPDMTLKSFSICGTASPEGRLESNQRLAAARMNSAMDVIMRSVPDNLKRNAAIKTDSRVASWSEVVALLRADGLDSEADQMQAIIDKSNGSADVQSVRMRKLPFFESLLREKYLPRLRRVNYTITTSRYRPLTDQEIATLYDSDYKQLSMYNFWKLYKSEANDSVRQTIMRRALEVHPKFLAAATDLSALLSNSGKSDPSVLAPFFTDAKTIATLPEVSRYDQAVSQLNSMHFTSADSLMTGLPDTERFHKGIIYTKALNGRYEDVMKEISEDSPLNEVLLLLAVKDNATAHQKAEQLGGSAVEEYVKAIAANRMDNYMAAITHLENAVALDPSLLDTARVDGDLTDLVEDLDTPSAQDDSEDSSSNSDTNE